MFTFMTPLYAAEEVSLELAMHQGACTVTHIVSCRVAMLFPHNSGSYEVYARRKLNLVLERVCRHVVTVSKEGYNHRLMHEYVPANNHNISQTRCLIA